LNVSVANARAGMRQFLGESRVRTVRERGAYLLTPHSEDVTALRIVIGMPFGIDAASDAWLHAVGTGILQAVLHAAQPITLVGVSSQDWTMARAQKKMMDDCAAAAGLLLFPYSLARDDYRKVTEAYEKLGKPVVHMNAPAVNAMSNYVAPDYFQSGRRLGEAWRQTGRKCVVLIGGASLNFSVSMQWRLSGLAVGLGTALGATTMLRYYQAPGATEEDGYRAMLALLRNRRSRPDAVYCSGDFLGLGAVRAARERGLKVPGEVSIAAGSGLNLQHTICADLTRTDQRFADIGREMVAMICARIDQQGRPLPAVLLDSPFIGGGTTRQQENKLLGIQ
jgi:LacI family transcriptional regulator